MNRKTTFVLLLLVSASLACSTTTPQGGMPVPADVELTVAPDIAERIKQLPNTPIDYDRTLLDDNERQVVDKLIEASKLMDQIFWLQVSEKNAEWHAALERDARVSPLHAQALHYFGLMKGPWDRLKEDDPFILAAGHKPEGAGFYPPDATKEEIERWIAAHPEDKAGIEGLFTVVRRDGSRLYAVPYSQYYRNLLEPAAQRLREAAAITRNASLRTYLTKRADAFLSDDYYESDVAWMDLDSNIEVVIGPYEVYEDEIFNFKAAYESFVTVVDKGESEKLTIYASHLPAMERNLPLPDEHKNPNRGTDSPIKVVQEIYTAGDARRGVQTAAFNLPNDEKVREAKGSKKVLLKNVMEAKYRQSGKPIAERVLDPSQTGLVSFAPYFNHTLFHELSHGVGPGLIKGPDGKRVDTRLLLKNLYSSIEECKADVLGVWNILYAMDKGLISGFDANALYATDVGLMFRSMRFGIDEAHGRGTAVQWNWYREKGAIVPVGGGRFKVDFAKMPEAVRSLAAELLMIEAVGDFDRGKRLLDRYGVSNAEIDGVIAGLKDIPVDIAPVFVGAGER